MGGALRGRELASIVAEGLVAPHVLRKRLLEQAGPRLARYTAGRKDGLSRATVAWNAVVDANFTPLALTVEPDYHLACRGIRGLGWKELRQELWLRRDGVHRHEQPGVGKATLPWLPECSPTLPSHRGIGTVQVTQPAVGNAYGVRIS